NTKGNIRERDLEFLLRAAPQQSNHVESRLVLSAGTNHCDAGNWYISQVKRGARRVKLGE
ncbi:MAG TPA: hypothetical protein VIR01_09505, partial [Pyrinomonadaceae bacterium]